MELFSKKTDFFELLLKHGDNVEKGLAALVDFIEAPTPEHATAVDRFEEDADDLRHALVDDLNRAFVTPIDREDIYALSRAMDDVIDYAKSTVEEILLFEIEPDAHIKKMVGVLSSASKDLAFSVRNLQKNLDVCAANLVRAKKSENEVEHLYREGLVELFKTKDVIRIMKTREVYRHLSNAADRVGEAADIIGDILVKNA